MAQNTHDMMLNKRDSIYKTWKFKSLKPLVGMVSIEIFDVLDLTNKDTLTYSIVGSSEKKQSLPYKIIDNAIIIQNQSTNTHVEYRISELTTNELKLVIHATFQDKDSKKAEVDLVELTFESKN